MQQVSFDAELLQPVVPRISDPEIAALIHREPPGAPELPRSSALAADPAAVNNFDSCDGISGQPPEPLPEREARCLAGGLALARQGRQRRCNGQQGSIAGFAGEDLECAFPRVQHEDPAGPGHCQA